MFTLSKNISFIAQLNWQMITPCCFELSQNFNNFYWKGAEGIPNLNIILPVKTFYLINSINSAQHEAITLNNRFIAPTTFHSHDKNSNYFHFFPLHDTFWTRSTCMHAFKLSPFFQQIQILFPLMHIRTPHHYRWNGFNVIP